MTALKTLSSIKNRIYGFLVNPKIVKVSIVFSLINFLGCVCIGIIIASLLGPTGYNFVDNYISDLGSIKYTPLPFFLDYGAISSSITLLPFGFCLEKVLNPLPPGEIGNREISRNKIRLTSLGILSFLIGMIGFFGIGLFSEDRTTSLGLHYTFSVVVFAGLIFTSIFFGLVITFFNTIFPRNIGIFMVVVPITPGIIFIFTEWPLMEWFMLFSILAWALPVMFLIYKTLGNLG